MKKIIVLIVVFSFLQSCESVKEYQKSKINDPEMKLSPRTSERFESTFQAYREGAEGGSGGKSGGGCGCN